MPRQARMVLPDFPHHVIQPGHNRQVVFAGDEVIREVAQRGQLTADKKIVKEVSKKIGRCLELRGPGRPRKRTQKEICPLFPADALASTDPRACLPQPSPPGSPAGQVIFHGNHRTGGPAVHRNCQPHPSSPSRKKLSGPAARLLLASALLCLAWLAQPATMAMAAAGAPRTGLIGIGDSLTQGTMDATNNQRNTANSYLQKVADSLAGEMVLLFSQPYFDDREKRLSPFLIPTNVAVDGDDIFSLTGLQYYKREGAAANSSSRELLADRLLPGLLKDPYDKVIYPINLFTKKPTSQLDAAIWLLNDGTRLARAERAIVVFWEGNNDSALATLGGGGANPHFRPLPFHVIKSELKPGLRLLLAWAEKQGVVSFAPYTMAAIERNLTESGDFAVQYEAALDRLLAETAASPVETLVLAITLPYYSAVGYLMDSEDLEFYLRKVEPTYSVPPSFARVTPAGSPITDFLKGDRISLFTFGMMYASLSSGHTVAEVNRILESNGVQQDGMVLSEEEQRFIMARIDSFNKVIRDAATARAPKVELADVGAFLNDAFLGRNPITVGDRVLTRKWVRGNGFSLDGVHPGYTSHGLIANLVLERLNDLLGISAASHDLETILARDPYIDRDGDGWAPGPDLSPSGITRLLFLLTDPDDTDASVQVSMPDNVWDIISDTLLADLLGIPPLQEEARRLGIRSSGF